MAGSDRLSELLVPSIIDRFDMIPAETVLSIPIVKGELALLIKSQYQLHGGLAAILDCLRAVTFDIELQEKISAAARTLYSSQEALGTSVTSLINRAVESQPT